MKRIVYALVNLAVGGIGLMMISWKSDAPKQKRPNVIYILADDMGYGDVAALNPQSKIPTPTLDKMVNEGLTFTDAHSNSAVSTPTRYGTLTGRYSFRTSLKSGVLVGHSPALIEPGRETLGTLLQESGYQTACIGKWHLGLDWKRKNDSLPLFDGDGWDIRNTEHIDYLSKVGGGPDEHGFDYSYILPASLDMAPYIYLENGVATSSDIKHIDSWSSDKARGIWYRHGDRASDFDHNTCLQTLTRKAVEYIDTASAKDKPFFMYFPLTAPHTPWFPTEEFVGKSGAGYYGDFVCMVDDVVKQVYDALEKNGIRENTIVIFTSDNGSHWLPNDVKQFGHQSNGIYSGYKSDIWEGGHRIPYLLTWPQMIKEGRRTDQLVCSTDLMATLAEMLGVTLGKSAGEDSFSFWNLVDTQSTNNNIRRRESLIHHSVNGNFAYREGDWVMLDCKGSGGWSLSEEDAKNLPNKQLYNLKEDITQKNNLSQDSERIQKMSQKMIHIVESGSSH